MSENEVEGASLDCLAMLFGPDEWLHRRVERIEFLDYAHVHRRVSIDLTIPNDPDDARLWAPADGKPDVYFLPVAMLRKRSLINFSMRSEDGQPVPVMSKHANGAISTGMLMFLANYAVEECLGHGVTDPNVKRLLAGIAFGTGKEAAAAHGALFEVQGGSPRSVEHILVATDEALRAFATDLATHFVLVARVTGFPGERRILKFEYDSPREWPAGVPLRGRASGARRVWTKVMAATGVGGTPFPIPVPASTDAASYHLEVHAPPGLVVEDAWFGKLVEGHDRLEEIVRPARSDVAVHFNPKRDRLFGGDVVAEVRLRLAASGVLASSVLACLLVVAVLGSGLALHHHGVRRDPDADTAALVVSLVAVLTTLLGGRNRHPVTAGISRGPLFAVNVATGIALAAGVSLSLVVASDLLVHIWGMLFLAALALLLMTGWAWIRSKYFERQTGS